MATSTIPTIGDGTFEELTVNTSAGSGEARIQRYGKLRFLTFVFRPNGAGAGIVVIQLGAQDAPSRDIYFAGASYGATGQIECLLTGNGDVAMSTAVAPNNTVKAGVAYMVP